ncbi:hypothetical protein BH20CHL6_BH20CHL6_19340 [soil metagenome]
MNAVLIIDPEAALGTDPDEVHVYRRRPLQGECDTFPGATTPPV